MTSAPSSEATPRLFLGGAGSDFGIYDEKGETFLENVGSREFAALIVAAVNSYDESRKLLEDVQKALDEVAGLDFEAEDCAHYKQLSARIRAHLEAGQ